jgi:hypothetical protein
MEPHCKNQFFYPLLLILLSIFAVSAAVKAQSMEWSNSRKLKGNAVFTKIIGENENGIFLMRYKNRFFNRSIYIEKYRSQLGFNFSRLIPLKKSRLIWVELNDEGLLLFSSEFDKSTKKNELRVQYFDFNLLPKTRSMVLEKAEPTEGYDRGDFRVVISSNKEKILTYFTEKTAQETRRIHLQVFDKSLKSIAKRQFETAVSYDLYQLTDMNLDNEGNAFVLLKERPKYSRKVADDFVSHKLYVWEKADDKIRSYQLNDTDRHLQQLVISIDRGNNQLNVNGFYGNESGNRFSGIFFFRMSILNTDSFSIFHTELGREIKTELIGEKFASEKMDLNDFNHLKAIPMSHGGITIIAERSSMSYEEDIIYINGVPQNTSRNIYNYDDVLILSMNQNGEMIWHRVINKNQSSLNDGGYYSSIAISNTNDLLHIVFNDKMRSNGNVMQYTINSDGYMENKILIKSDREFISIIPIEARQVSSNKLLIPVTRDKKFALLKLVY